MIEGESYMREGWEESREDEGERGEKREVEHKEHRC